MNTHTQFYNPDFLIFFSKKNNIDMSHNTTPHNQFWLAIRELILTNDDKHESGLMSSREAERYLNYEFSRSILLSKAKGGFLRYDEEAKRLYRSDIMQLSRVIELYTLAVESGAISLSRTSREITKIIPSRIAGTKGEATNNTHVALIHLLQDPDVKKFIEIAQKTKIDKI
jgi:hypothetical protein